MKPLMADWDWDLFNRTKIPNQKQATIQSEKEHETNPWQAEEDKERRERFWYGD